MSEQLGNIRVAIRVRPLNRQEQQDDGGLDRSSHDRDRDRVIAMGNHGCRETTTITKPDPENGSRKRQQ